MNLASAFASSAQKHSDSVGVFWGDVELSYQQLFQQALQVRTVLVQHTQLKPRARVGLWLKNCPDFVSCLFGSWMAEAVVVPINNFLRPREVSYILANAGIDVLISETALSEGFGELQASQPGLRILPVETLAKMGSASPSEWTSPPQTESDLALIIYTSGTTGHPKGAMLSHGNLLHNVESCRQMLQAVSFDRFVVLLPMFHSFMLTVGILLPLSVGGSMVLIKTLQSPKTILAEALARQATILPAIPQFFRALTNAALPENLSLRLCISGAAPLPREVLREFNEKFPIPLLEGYGLSEASPVVSMNPI
ncbi:MAG: AMP-binding protein [Verrucomicrobiota bacterium]